MRDIDIRRKLSSEMKRQHSGDSDTLILHELGLCKGIARVDLAVVNGNIHGYEIKSQQDTLVRLPHQAGIYSRALEFVTIVASPSHATKIESIVPPWWGLWTAIQSEDEIRLERVRDAHPNPQLDPLALAQLLWRDEVLQALIDREFAVGMRSKSRDELCKHLASNVSLQELGEVVRMNLKRRGASWRVPVSQA